MRPDAAGMLRLRGRSVGRTAEMGSTTGGWSVSIPPTAVPTRIPSPCLPMSERSERPDQHRCLPDGGACGAVGAHWCPPSTVPAGVTDQDGEELRAYGDTEWRRAVSAEAADLVRRGMVSTAENGSAEGLLIPEMPDLEIGGKTGTAQLGGEGPPRSHAWIIGFAGPPGEAEVAVAVIVQGQPGTDQTGGQVAAPIAQAVMQAVLAERGGR